MSAENRGWDLEIVRDGQETIRVEVKATKDERVSAVELTAREWQAAKEHGKSYWLAIVTSCLENEQTVAFVENPSTLAVDISAYRLTGLSSSSDADE